MNDKESVITSRFGRIAGIVAAMAAATNGIGDIFHQAVRDGVYAAALLVPLIPRYGTYLGSAAALSDALFFAVSTKLLWNVET